MYIFHENKTRNRLMYFLHKNKNTKSFDGVIPTWVFFSVLKCGKGVTYNGFLGLVGW